MIFVTNKIYAKIWKIEKKEKYAELRISTSEKVEKDGETSYINSNWFARAIGKAFNQLKDINEGDRIVIAKAKLSNEMYEKDGEKKHALRFIILEFDTNENTSSGDSDESDEALPF